MKSVEQIQLDGSLGEGGGQILRTALALSMVTRRPFRIENIRAGRPKPGLMRQHLTAVQAAQQVSGAKVTGARVGTTSLEFAPSEIRAGDYEFAIGTAGSTTLVLQTVLPALMLAPTRSTLVLRGGTHNIFAPSVHFLQFAFLPLLRRMGPRVELTLERHGFYPAGGGRIVVTIEPCTSLKPLELMERGEIKRRRAVASVAGLPGEIARRELEVVREKLGWDESWLQVEQLKDAVGPGNILSIEVESEALTEVFTGFGQRGVSAEAVGDRTVRQVREYLKANVPVWNHLADQLLVPMAVSGRGSFCTGPLSRHSTTNINVIQSFVSTSIETTVDEAGRTMVQVSVTR